MARGRTRGKSAASPEITVSKGVNLPTKKQWKSVHWTQRRRKTTIKKKDDFAPCPHPCGLFAQFWRFSLTKFLEGGKFPLMIPLSDRHTHTPLSQSTWANFTNQATNMMTADGRKRGKPYYAVITVER